MNGILLNDTLWIIFQLIMVQKYEGIFDKIKYFIKTKNNNSDDCDENMKFRINLGDDLPLAKIY